ncbi:hypothetical protein EBU99_14420 [bacterium]|nr:hypothetical protein [bacterium]
MRLRIVFALLLLLSCSIVEVSCSKSSAQGSSSGSQAASALGQAKGNIFTAKILSWSKGPEVSGDSVSEMNNACVIEIKTADDKVPESISVSDIFPFMKIHGHGAPDDQITWKVEGNQIIASKISFIMSGPWELHVKAVVNGQTEELEIPVVVP